jgi:hypothetical protein
MAQAFASGNHFARSYGCQASQAGPKQSKLKIHLNCSCNITRYTKDSPVICRRYLPRRKSELSIVHMTIAIAKTIFVLFHMAILSEFFERLASGE